jgi:hypothetical protein
MPGRFATMKALFKEAVVLGPGDQWEGEAKPN